MDHVAVTGDPNRAMVGIPFGIEMAQRAAFHFLGDKFECCEHPRELRALIGLRKPSRVQSWRILIHVPGTEPPSDRYPRRSVFLKRAWNVTGSLSPTWSRVR